MEVQRRDKADAPGALQAGPDLMTVFAPHTPVRASALGIDRAKVIGVRVRSSRRVRYELAWGGRSAWVSARHVEALR